MSKAIVAFGSFQYEVKPGDKIEVLRVPRSLGEQFDWDKVLMLQNEASQSASIGRPYVSGAKVRFEVLKHSRDKKVIVFKKRSKKNWKRKMGHRSALTKLLVKEIIAGSAAQGTPNG